MSEESSQERTEEATPKRQQDSKEKGVVARSKDFNTTLLLIFAGIGFLCFGNMIASDCLKIFTLSLGAKDVNVMETQAMFTILREAAVLGVAVLTPFLILCALACFIGPLLVGSINVSIGNVALKFDRLDPIKGLGKIFSMKSMMELVKSILKLVLVSAFCVLLFYMFFEEILQLSQPMITSSIAKVFDIVEFSFFILCSSLIIISMIDVPFQVHEHHKQIKMTKQEVKDELKESDVRPEVKNKILKTQRDISRQRMMSKIPEADVIITNPTHFAVAIKYDDKKMKAPKLLAKGADNVAEKIRQVAKHHDIPIVQIPMLSRAIYYNTEIDQEIPSRLYVACAQVLAYVYKLKMFKKGKAPKPKLPSNINVPKDMVK